MEPAVRSVLERDNVRAIFQQWDTGNTGVINRDELSQALLKLGLSASKSQIDTFFNAADLNKDGAISYEEFVEYLFQPAISAEARANLGRRFPNASEELIAVALATAGGHGGNAAKALQNSSAAPEPTNLSPAPAESYLPLRVHLLSGSTIHALKALTSTVLALKASLEPDCGIPPGEQVLTLEGRVLANDVQFGDLCVSGVAISSVPPEQSAAMREGLDLNLVRVRPLALLCPDALKLFRAKNLTESPIKVSFHGNTAPKNSPRTLEVGEDWTFAKTDFWDGRYFDLDLVSGGTIASENGVDRDKFTVDASDEFGHAEHWGLKFVVRGYDCSAKITEAPPSTAARET